MTNKHTPEPWRRSTKSWDGDKIMTIVGPQGEEIVQEPTEFYAYDSGAFVTPDGLSVNLDRIIVCINACAGLSNEYLEEIGDGGLAILAKATGKLMAAIGEDDR